MNPIVFAAKNSMIGGFICLFLSSASANSITYKWTDTPIDIDLPVGTERNIHIPEADTVRMGIPSSIDSLLLPQIIGNHIWLKALDEFDSTRIILIAEPVGRLILQIQARSSDSSVQPIVIKSLDSVDKTIESKSPPSHGFVKLTRWAAQKFYAPKRLVSDIPGVVRIPVDNSPVNLFRCGRRIPTACAGAVSSVPLSSWQSPHHFVTALHITNNLSKPIILDPRELRGQWRTAAFLHTRLHPRGQFGDSTMLILISDFPFESPAL